MVPRSRRGFHTQNNVDVIDSENGRQQERTPQRRLLEGHHSISIVPRQRRGRSSGLMSNGPPTGSSIETRIPPASNTRSARKIRGIIATGAEYASGPRSSRGLNTIARQAHSRCNTSWIPLIANNCSYHKEVICAYDGM